MRIRCPMRLPVAATGPPKWASRPTFKSARSAKKKTHSLLHKFETHIPLFFKLLPTRRPPGHHRSTTNLPSRWPSPNGHQPDSKLVAFETRPPARFKAGGQDGGPVVVVAAQRVGRSQSPLEPERRCVCPEKQTNLLVQG